MAYLPVVDLARLKSDVTLNAVAGANATSAAVNMNSNNFSNLAAATVSGEAVEFSQFEAALDGLSYKDAVELATTPAGGNLTLSGEQTIDGTLTSASRIMVKDQTNAAENGIYVTGAGAWSRADDANTAAEITDGATAWVQGGTLNADTRWTVTSTVATLNTDDVDFAQTGSASSVTALSDLTDADTAAAVDGSIFRYEAGSSEWQATTGSNLLLTDAGQLQVPTTGSGAGIVLGGDAQLYRSAADVLRTPDSLTVDVDLAVTGNADFNGAVSFDTRAVSGPTSAVVAADDHIIICDTSGGVVTINLPAAASNAGRDLIVKDNGSAGTTAITIDGNASETLDGAATLSVDENYHSVRLHCDGTEWYVL